MNLRLAAVAGISIVLSMSLYHCGSPKKTATSTATPPPHSKESVIAIAQKRWPDATIESLRAGQDIYNNQCTKCHDAKDINDYSEDEWLPLIDKMSRKAHLDDSDKEIVRRYILSVREALANNTNTQSQ